MKRYLKKLFDMKTKFLIAAFMATSIVFVFGLLLVFMGFFIYEGGLKLISPFLFFGILWVYWTVINDFVEIIKLREQAKRLTKPMKKEEIKNTETECLTNQMNKRKKEFTGVRDWKLSDINEGDILLSQQGTVFVVAWSQDNKRWIIVQRNKGSHPELIGDWFALEKWMQPNIKIIGSIYQSKTSVQNQQLEKLGYKII